MARTLALRDQLLAGLAAGIAGGIVIDAFLLAMAFAGGATPAQALGMYPWIASVVFGHAILANPAAPALGVLLHFGVSIFWALGYVYLVRSQPQLLTRPYLSGAGFGLVVYCFMQIMLITAGEYHRPSPQALGIGLVAHIVFFGMTVALVVSRLLRRPSAAA
ncbi:MAG TPA: hypothetical protein VMA36_05820 [Candidatus Limnocylindria bacterium]|nr:hypothetical protein [Candidatus Limnocylindria bacterium]